MRDVVYETILLLGSHAGQMSAKDLRTETMKEALSPEEYEEIQDNIKRKWKQLDGKGGVAGIYVIFDEFRYVFSDGLKFLSKEGFIEKSASLSLYQITSKGSKLLDKMEEYGSDPRTRPSIRYFTSQMKNLQFLDKK